MNVSAKSPAILIALIALLALGISYVLFGDTGSAGGDEVNGTGGTGSGTELVQRETNIVKAAGAQDKAQKPEPIGAQTAKREEVRTKEKKVAPQAAATEPTGPWLTGWVSDVNGYGVADAEVKVSGKGAAASLLTFTGSPFVERTKSGPDGSFRVTRNGLIGDDVQVEVKARGFLVNEVSATPSTESGDAELVDVVLERGVVLSGMIVDSRGEPVEDVRLSCTRQGEVNYNFGFGGRGGFQGEKSDAEGRFDFEHQTPGDYVIRASHEKYPNVSYEVSADLAGQEVANVYMQFPQSASITGRLVGMPLSAQNVQIFALPTKYGTVRETLGPRTMLEQYSGSTDGAQSDVEANGKFELHGLLANQNYELMATVPGAMMQRLRCSDHQVVRGGDQEVELIWDKGATVKFQLVDAQGKNPILSSSVNYKWNSADFDGWQMGSTRRDFRSSQIEITELRPMENPARLNVLVSAPGFMSMKLEDVEVREDEVTDLGQVVLERAPMIRIHVSDAVTGEPIKSARIALSPKVEGVDEDDFAARFGSLIPETKKGKTEKDGWADVENCATEIADLKVQARGYADYTKVQELGSDSQLEIRVRMEEGAEIQITVLDSEGEPVQDGHVSYRGPNELEGNGNTTSKGVLRLRDMASGDYRARANRSRGWRSGTQDSEWVNFRVAAGQTTEVGITLPLETTVSGIVRVNGEPARAASVSFVNPSSKGNNMTNWRGGMNEETDGKGRFELTSVEPGEHKLQVNLADGAAPHLYAVTLAEGKNSVTIDLTASMISGFVVDQAGAPIAGARITMGFYGEQREQTYEGQNGELHTGTFSDWFGSNGSAKTDSRGRFEITGMPLKGTFQLTVEAKGYVTLKQTIEGVEGAKDLRMAMESAGKMKVTLTGNGEDNFVSVIAKSLETDQTYDEWGQGSTINFDGLPAGRYKVYTMRWDEEGKVSGEDKAIEVEIRLGETKEVTLAL